MRSTITFIVGSAVLVAAAALLSRGVHQSPPPPGLVTQPLSAAGVVAPDSRICIDCHREETPAIYNDWRLSEHRKQDVACADCHGDGHTSADDVAEVSIPTPETCATCHSERVEEFSRGKHAQAWNAMNVMPTTHWLPTAALEGMKGCGGCHKIGLKTDAEIARLKLDEGAGFGVASCDACHTRHTFSVEEARSPEACRTCHNGPDHAQWDMYVSSKHGVRYELKRSGVLHENAAAPTCQTCHMPDGAHDVNTAWGFFGLRLPVSDDPDWAEDQLTILRALGAADAEGNIGGRANGMKRIGAIKTTAEEWQVQRDRMIQTCSQCHSTNFASAQLANSDSLIRAADALMADAIMEVADLYEDGLLRRPADYTEDFPDLLALHDAPSTIEMRLYEMFQHHRMQTFQGAFHSSPEHSLWHGWSEMLKDATAIREMALVARDR